MNDIMKTVKSLEISDLLKQKVSKKKKKKKKNKKKRSKRTKRRISQNVIRKFRCYFVRKSFNR